MSGDLEKVLRELEKSTGIIKTAIEVAKQGGVGTEKEAIRDKAIEWNNYSTKKVPYEFIDYVEGKRDIVANDVCVWKYSSLTGNWDSDRHKKVIKDAVACDWKVCPYCGKKIKVV